MKTKFTILIIIISLAVGKLHSEDWVKCSIGLETAGGINAFMTKDNKIFACSGSGMYFDSGKRGMFVSKDNGDSWQSISNGIAGIGVNRIMSSGNSIYIGTDNGVYKSDNDGEVWMPINSGLKIPISGLAKIGNTLFAGTFDKGVYKSNNDGADWVQSINGMDQLDVLCVIQNGNEIFCGTILGGVYKSTDLGETWIQKNEGIENTRIVAMIVNHSDIYAGSLDGGVYFSSDDGESWEIRNNGFGDNMDTWSFAINDNTIYTGVSGYGVYYSTNKGQKWESSLHIWEDFHALSLTINNGYIFCGFSNGSVYKMKLPGSSNINETENQVLRIYPNPTKDFVTITDFSGQAIIYNTMGIEVWSGIVLEGMEIDVSQFSEGLYFVKLNDSNKKFIIKR